jgi:hypothetical protein
MSTNQVKSILESAYGFSSVVIRRIRMFFGLPDPHPDPLVTSTDPRIRIGIRIRTKNVTYPQDCLKWKVQRRPVLYSFMILFG